MWILYEKLPKETKERVAYTKADEEAFAERYAEMAIDYRSDLKFKALWEQCEQSKAGILEEGIYKSWHEGRVVLVGDAVSTLLHGQFLTQY